MAVFVAEQHSSGFECKRLASHRCTAFELLVAAQCQLLFDLHHHYEKSPYLVGAGFVVVGGTTMF